MSDLADLSKYTKYIKEAPGWSATAPTQTERIIEASPATAVAASVNAVATYESLIRELPTGFIPSRTRGGDFDIVDSCMLVGCPKHYHYYPLTGLSSIKCKTCTGGTAGVRDTHRLVEAATGLAFTLQSRGVYSAGGVKLYILKPGSDRPPAGVIAIHETKSASVVGNVLAKFQHLLPQSVKIKTRKRSRARTGDTQQVLLYHTDCIPGFNPIRKSSNPLLLIENCVWG